FSRLTLEQKIAVVRPRKQEGQRILFVGDGINDAAAMAENHVAVAVGSEPASVRISPRDSTFAMSQRSVPSQISDVGPIDRCRRHDRRQCGYRVEFVVDSASGPT